jgi:hypothetical protein
MLRIADDYERQRRSAPNSGFGRLVIIKLRHYPKRSRAVSLFAAVPGTYLPACGVRHSEWAINPILTILSTGATARNNFACSRMGSAIKRQERQSYGLRASCPQGARTAEARSGINLRTPRSKQAGLSSSRDRAVLSYRRRHLQELGLSRRAARTGSGGRLRDFRRDRGLGIVSAHGWPPNRIAI